MNEQLLTLYGNVGDLYIFDKEILGYEQMAEAPHRLMCDSVILGGNRQLHLWPRGHFKSSCITIGYVIQQIALNPNIRILIANATLGNAKSFLREIKGHLEHNEALRAVIGDHVNKEDKWTETEIISAKRTRNLKEPTIQVAGVGQGLASQHYDLIVGDDLVNELTVTTAEQIEKTKNWFRLALSLLDPEGSVILIGTRYHFGDLYGWLIEEFSHEFSPQIHGAVENGQPIFPSRFTLNKLNEIRRSQGSYIYSCQYLNNPVDDISAKFKKVNMQYYEEEELRGKQLYTTYTIDRAYSLNKTADKTAHVIVSTDLNNNWYVRLALQTQELEGALINRIFDNVAHFKVDRTGIEQLAYTATIKPALEDEMRRRNQFITVEELKGRSSKISRIEGLVPRHEANTIYLLNDMMGLEDQLLRFPTATHDDLIDALAYQLDIARVPTIMAEQEVKQMLAVRLNEEW